MIFSPLGVLTIRGLMKPTMFHVLKGFNEQLLPEALIKKTTTKDQEKPRLSALTVTVLAMTF